MVKISYNLVDLPAFRCAIVQMYRRSGSELARFAHNGIASGSYLVACFLQQCWVMFIDWHEVVFVLQLYYIFCLWCPVESITVPSNIAFTSFFCAITSTPYVLLWSCRKRSQVHWGVWRRKTWHIRSRLVRYIEKVVFSSIQFAASTESLLWALKMPDRLADVSATPWPWSRIYRYGLKLRTYLSGRVVPQWNPLNAAKLPAAHSRVWITGCTAKGWAIRSGVQSWMSLPAPGKRWLEKAEKKILPGLVVHNHRGTCGEIAVEFYTFSALQTYYQRIRSLLRIVINCINSILCRFYKINNYFSNQ